MPFLNISQVIPACQDSNKLSKLQVLLLNKQFVDKVQHVKIT